MSLGRQSESISFYAVYAETDVAEEDVVHFMFHEKSVTCIFCLQEISDRMLFAIVGAACFLCSSIVYFLATKKRKILMIDFECFAPPNK